MYVYLGRKESNLDLRVNLMLSFIENMKLFFFLPLIKRPNMSKSFSEYFVFALTRGSALLQ